MLIIYFLGGNIMSGNGDGLGSTRRYDLNEINDRLSTRPTRTNKNVRGKKNKDMNRNKKNKKQNKAWKVVKIILITILVLGILAALIIGGIIAGLFLGLFGNDFKLTKEDLLLSNQNSEVYNADGKLIATLTGDEKRKIVPMSEMSKYLPKQLSEEDVNEIIRKADVYEDASPRTKGMIIKAVMPQIAGKFDKAKVNGLVEKHLASKQ